MIKKESSDNFVGRLFAGIKGEVLDFVCKSIVNRRRLFKSTYVKNKFYKNNFTQRNYCRHVKIHYDLAGESVRELE